jgi:hypothetical protein
MEMQESGEDQETLESGEDQGESIVAKMEQAAQRAREEVGQSADENEEDQSQQNTPQESFD